MRRVFITMATSRLLLVLVAVGWTAASVALSLQSSQWHWFQRSGAVTVVAGATLSIRRILRLGGKGFFQAETTIDGGHAAPTPDEIEADRQFRLDISSMQLGGILLALGTLIWAYGDLVGGSQ